jgi:hypothetical protein
MSNRLIWLASGLVLASAAITIASAASPGSIRQLVWDQPNPCTVAKACDPSKRARVSRILLNGEPLGLFHDSRLNLPGDLKFKVFCPAQPAGPTEISYSTKSTTTTITASRHGKPKSTITNGLVLLHVKPDAEGCGLDFG